jgi:hypothetical protein
MLINFNLLLVDVCVWCCVLLGRGVGVGLITLPEESYRVVCPMRVILMPRNVTGPAPLGAIVP